MTLLYGTPLGRISSKMPQQEVDVLRRTYDMINTFYRESKINHNLGSLLIKHFVDDPLYGNEVRIIRDILEGRKEYLAEKDRRTDRGLDFPCWTNCTTPSNYHEDTDANGCWANVVRTLEDG